MSRPPRTTRDAARELGVTYNRLINLLRFDKMVPPGRHSSGDYFWTDTDLARARKALQGVRGRKAVTA
jgi:hypothetical protein